MPSRRPWRGKMAVRLAEHVADTATVLAAFDRRVATVGTDDRRTMFRAVMAGVAWAAADAGQRADKESSLPCVRP